MAQQEDITIDQGADFAMEIELIDKFGAAKNLTGYSAEAMLKKSYNVDSDQATDMNAIIAEPATAGVVTLSLTNIVTDALKAGRYVYGVEISFQDSDSNTIVERVLQGRATITPSVVR